MEADVEVRGLIGGSEQSRTLLENERKDSWECDEGHESNKRMNHRKLTSCCNR